MLVNQLAVFLENKKGKLAGLTKTLAEKGIDLISLSIADTLDFGIVRIITNDNELALNELKSAGYTVTSSNLIAICVPDKPNGLHKAVEAMDSCDIAIEYMYSLARKEQGRAILLFKVKDIDKALKVLAQNSDIELLKETILTK